MTEEQRLALCSAYLALIEEYTSPKINGAYNPHEIALGYIQRSMPEMAVYHVINAGVPREVVITLQTLVLG